MTFTCWIQHFDGIERAYPFEQLETAEKALRLFRGCRLIAEVDYRDIAGWVLGVSCSRGCEAARRNVAISNN